MKDALICPVFSWSCCLLLRLKVCLTRQNNKRYCDSFLVIIFQTLSRESECLGSFLMMVCPDPRWESEHFWSHLIVILFRPSGESLNDLGSLLMVILFRPSVESLNNLGSLLMMVCPVPRVRVWTFLVPFDSNFVQNLGWGSKGLDLLWWWFCPDSQPESLNDSIAC